MDKIKIDLSLPETRSFTEGAKEILVKPYLTSSEQIVLINSYMMAYFFPVSTNTNKGLSEYDYIGAEYSLKLNIIDICTNIQVFDDNGNVMDDMSRILYNGIWNSVRGCIKNYDEFRTSLYAVKDDIKFQLQLSKSIGYIVENMSNKILAIFERLSSMDLSPENLKVLRETVETISKQLEDSPIGRVYKEASESRNG